MPTIHVCTTCRAGQTIPDGTDPPGRHLFDALLDRLRQDPRPGLTLRPVKCLSSCDHGCAAAISAPGKWSYLLGRLDPGLVPDLLTYADAYAAHPTGTVLPSRRPPALGRMVLGRMPDLAMTPQPADAPGGAA